jgi:hypothetical protein
MHYSTGFHTPPTPGMSPHYGRQPSMPEPGMMYPVPPVLSGSNGSVPDNNHVRVVQTRPKPQCWEHGCNGRQFSTFSNLLRHQREKSGQAAKATCPNCGAEFTRTTVSSPSRSGLESIRSLTHAARLAMVTCYTTSASSAATHKIGKTDFSRKIWDQHQVRRRK